MDLLDRLLGHDRWTTGRFLELSRGLTDAQLDQPFDIGHHTVRGTFEHMTGAINFWNELMAGVPIPNQSDDRSIAALAEQLRAFLCDLCHLRPPAYVTRTVWTTPSLMTKARI